VHSDAVARPPFEVFSPSLREVLPSDFATGIFECAEMSPD
jgi:hypothetical protein